MGTINNFHVGYLCGRELGDIDGIAGHVTGMTNRNCLISHMTIINGPVSRNEQKRERIVA